MDAGSGGSMDTGLPVVVLMWWVMMVAMMTPGAAPLMLLYGAVLRRHAFCVGCCWMMMALLFVGGIMNLVWIAALSLLIMAEKLLPAGAVVAKVSGGLLMAWAGATLLV